MTSSEDARLRLEAIIDSAVFAIVTIDVAGTIEAFNLAAETMFGYASDEV
ncbi:MAG: PAS domain S-box protein, partial [Hyphomicrobiaceae bacterium]